MKINSMENSLKRYLKRKIKVTLGLIVAFMITGVVGYAEVIREPIIEIENISNSCTSNDNWINNKWIEGIGADKEFETGEIKFKSKVYPSMIFKSDGIYKGNSNSNSLLLYRK